MTASPHKQKAMNAFGVTLLVLILLFTVGLAVLAFRVVQRGDVAVRLGDEKFDAGQIGRISTEIADRGPILYSDVAGGDRDILLNHLGPEPESGWFAFDARSKGSARDCFVTWIAEESVLEDTCTAEHFPADGTGLEQYPVVVTEGSVIIDLNAALRPPPASTAIVTTTVVETGIPRDDG